MGRCVLWAGASYGPVRLMGRCVLWTRKYGTSLSLAEKGLLQHKATSYKHIIFCRNLPFTRTWAVLFVLEMGSKFIPALTVGNIARINMLSISSWQQFATCYCRWHLRWQAVTFENKNKNFKERYMQLLIEKFFPPFISLPPPSPEQGSAATCHWCGTERQLNFQEVWITGVHILLVIWCKYCHSQINKIFKYIIIIITDILILIRTIRNLSAFLIFHYSVNTLFATSTAVFSTSVRPLPVQLFYIRRGPGPNKFTRKDLSNFIWVHTLN